MKLDLTPTPGDAKVRRRVRVTIPDRPAFLAQLVYWPGDNRRGRSKADPSRSPSSSRSAVVLTSGGAYIRVPLSAVELAGPVDA